MRRAAEESFVKNLLAPYLNLHSIDAIPIVCTTKHLSNRSYKGGVASYNKIRNELRMLCRQHGNELVTTMFDYYGLPKDTPSMEDNEKEIYRHVENIESAIESDIDMKNCRFNLTVHEFEALLFSNPESFGVISPESVKEVRRIKDKFGNPERINNSQSTAPSKRLQGIIDGYSKVRMGLIVANDIGIERILEECPHFREWVDCIIRDSRNVM